MTNDNDAHHDTGTGSLNGPDTDEATELQAEIEQTREDLAETVDLLTAKLDVKSRVRDQVSYILTTTKETAAHQFRSVHDKTTGPDGKPTPAAISVAGGVVAAVVAVVVVRLWLGSSGHQQVRHRRAWRRGR